MNSLIFLVALFDGNNCKRKKYSKTKAQNLVN